MTLTEAYNLIKIGTKEDKERGFKVLYDSTYAKSSYVAKKYLKNDTDTINDILQDSYIKAFKNIDQIEDPGKFSGWFSTIVANTSLNELKKRKPMLFSEIDNEEEGLQFEDSLVNERIDLQPEVSLDASETKRLVQEMIDTLSDEQRMCIMMYYLEELSVKEIADTLNTSENTVKSRLNYGRKAIKEKVLDLERKGTKLYGLLPFAFFLLASKMEAKACETSILPGIDTIIKEEVLQSSGRSFSSIKTASATKKTNILKATKLATKTKVLIGSITSALAITAGVAIINSAVKYDKQTTYDGALVFHEKTEDGLYVCYINSEKDYLSRELQKVTLKVDDKADFELICFEFEEELTFNHLIPVKGKEFKELEFGPEILYDNYRLYDLAKGFWGLAEVKDGVINSFSEGLREVRHISIDYNLDE